MGKRRRARELALQYLYQWDFHGPDDGEPVKTFWESRKDSDEIKAFAFNIISGVTDRRAEIDQLIEGQSQHWKLYRMSRIDRNILRMALFEILSEGEAPPKVCIDEAIEIAKKYGTTESGSFINGILDQICRKLGKLEARAGKDGKHEPPGKRDPG